MAQNVSLPLKRQEGLLVKTVQDEMVVYDTNNAQANCLNQTAALVWEYADGNTSVSELARKVEAKLGTPVDERIVWYALDQLHNKNLMEGTLEQPQTFRNLSRRDLLKRAALVGALVAIPTVISITAPSAIEAATCLSSGSACASGTQCCSSICTGAGLCL